MSAAAAVLMGGALAPALASTVDHAAGARAPHLTKSPGALTASLRAEPFGEYVGRLSFDVASVDPALVTAAGPIALTVTGTMTNAGPEGLTDLSYRFQRGAALDNAAGVRAELAQPSEPTDHVPGQFTAITPALAAGGSAPFSFTAPITTEDGLAVSAPGVYPIMVNVNGAVTLEGGPLEARVGELHLLLTVMGVPGGSVGAGSTSGVGNLTGRPLPVNFVWPLVDRPHLGVGGVFLDEDLLAAISPGGRLTTLVDGLTDPAAASLPGGSVTTVIDPQLLDELDRMTRAYRVVAAVGSPQPPMTAMLQAAGSPAAATPGATGSTAAPATPTVTPGTPASSAPPVPDAGSADIPGTVAGTGQAAAASFLGRLRDVAARYPMLVLPYGDPDVVAMVRAGLVGEVPTAVQHGDEVARRVLASTSATRLTTTLAYPINGAVDGPTLATLRSAGLGVALLSENSIDPAGSTAGNAQVALGDGSGRPVPAAIAQPDVLNGVGALIDQGRQSGWAMRVNALTGVLAQQSLDGVVTPAVFTPDRRWAPDAPELRVLTDLLSTLGSSQVIHGVALGDLASSATAATAVAYPESAQAQELSASYLDRVRTNRAEVASLRKTLASTNQSTDPALVLDPLDVALDAAASTAFRQDAAVGEANLATVESTTAGIRNGVEMSSAGNSYTLASSTSPLVLTVQNNLPYDVPVRVEITGGERVGLTVSDPGFLVVPAGRSQQVKIPAEVSRSGQFQVSARLVGPDGTLWGPPVQLSVDSTAYGALTVVIIVVAGGVLVLMVALRIVQRLRARRERIAAEAAAAETAATNGAGTPHSGSLRDVISRQSTPTPVPDSSPPADHVGTERP